MATSDRHIDPCHCSVAIQGYPRRPNNSTPARAAAVRERAPFPSFRLPDMRIFAMFRWFETRIEAFPDETPVRPPETLLAFYVHFIRPIWPAFAVLLVAGFAGAPDRGGADGLRRQPGRPDEGRPDAAGLHQRARQHAAVDGVRRRGRPAGGLHRARPDQEPGDRRAGDDPRALADAPLRAAPEPRLLPERLRRPRRQQGDAGGDRRCASRSCS